MKKISSVALLALAAGGLRGDVVDSAAGGFTVKITVAIAAPPDEVYGKLVGNVGDWWSKEHTYSGDSRNLSIEEKPGGCFCEKVPGGGAKHMEVVNFAPGKMLVMHGALGPLQTMAASGSMLVQLAAANGGTNLVLTYAVTGYSSRGLNTLAAPVDMVLTQQVTRLKNLVERGDASKAEPSRQP
jgi:hypothetical protein